MKKSTTTNMGFSTKRHSQLSTHLLLWFGLILAVFGYCQPAQAKRVALVVGNAAYADQPLKNPVNDAKAVSGKLKALGFEVTLVENLKKREVGRTLAGFAQKIGRDDEVVVFYAGHGLQVRGENYLPTVDAKIESEEDVETNSLKLGDLLSKLDESRARVKIVILDACRNNPYSKGFRSLDRGLARVQDAPSGTLMHFATRPGQVAADGEGGNGLYTTELLKVLDKPGIAVEQLFKQVSQAVVQSSREQQEPWQEGSLRGEFYFASAVAPAIAVKPNPIQEPLKADAEQEAWELAKKRDTFEAYQGYLSEFPKGRYAAAARSVLKGLTPNNASVKDPSSTLAAPVAQMNAELEAWELAKRRDTAQSYQAYINEYPTGKFVSAARSSINGFVAQASIISSSPNSDNFNLESITGTLKKIRDTRTIVIGYRESSVPFSYLHNQKPIGYSIDLCNRIIDSVKAKLEIPDLNVKLQPVTSANRFPLLLNGTVDIECGSTANSVKRQEQVSFGNTTFVTNVKVVVKKNSGIKSLADLNEQPIATTMGTSSVQLIKRHEKGVNLNFKEVYGKDHAESFLLMASDRAKAFVMDDVLIAGLIANSDRPYDYEFLPEVLRNEPYGLVIRKDDPQFKSTVDEVLNRLMKSGEINSLYAKWFTSTIPPKNINLNFPMSDTLKQVISNPNSVGVN